MKTFLLVMAFVLSFQGIGFAQDHCKDAYKVGLDCYGGSMKPSDVWSYYKNREYVSELAQLCQISGQGRRHIPVEMFVDQQKEWYEDCIKDVKSKKQKARANVR